MIALAILAAAHRAARLAGRAVGAVEQLRDVALVATVPLKVRGFPWALSLRAAFEGLRGRDLGPLLFVRRVATKFPTRVVRSSPDAERALRERFEARRREAN